MRKILNSIGFFMIAFAASCITFYALNGKVTLDRLIVAIILGLIAIFYNRRKVRKDNKEHLE